MTARKRTVTLAIVVLSLGACSDDGASPVDGGRDQLLKDYTTIPQPENFIGWPCEPEGSSCNPHDPCAINALCSPQGICIPSSYMDCDDGLTCTQDLCKGMGLCDNVPKKDSCALPVQVGGTTPKTEIRCFEKDDQDPQDPCQLCDPDTDSTHWTPANGGACDDGNDCTKDDYCQSGSCKGVYYGTQCADEYGCTDDLCDGKGGCVGNQLKSDWCLINGDCHKDQATHPNGTCFICDVKSSQSAWTPISDTCMIANICQNKGAKHPTGVCADCDPAKSTSAWTPTGSGCLIDDKCYQAGDKDTIQCSQCDPTASTTAWTPLSGLCKIDGQCYQAGTQHSQGCAECKPTVNATAWTLTSTTQCLIGSKCYNPGDKDTLGCSTCNLATPTAWTKIPGCFNIVFTALNEAHDGKLGGLAAADALCAQQAAQGGFSGTFKAFLSTATQNVKDLVTGTNASGVAVLNTKGEKLYDSWNGMFSATKWSSTAIRIYSFNGTEVDEGKVTPDWYDGRAWHGSTTAGTVSSTTCQDWTSNSSTVSGSNGELDYANVSWLSSYTNTCNTLLAVVCVQTAP